MKKEDIILLIFIFIIAVLTILLGIEDGKREKANEDYAWLSGYNTCITDILNSNK